MIKFETVGDDEENIVGLKITQDLQIDDFVKMIKEEIVNKE